MADCVTDDCLRDGVFCGLCALGFDDRMKSTFFFSKKSNILFFLIFVASSIAVDQGGTWCMINLVYTDRSETFCIKSTE